MESGHWRNQRCYRRGGRATGAVSNPLVFHYTAFIYERLARDYKYGTGVFDVEVFTSRAMPVFVSSDGRRRRLIYVTRAEYKSAVKINKLTAYLLWKFRHCQKNYASSARPLRYGGIFTHIRHEFGWIRSIVDTEFDYHVGKKVCTVENAEYFKAYGASQFTGYGPKYCNLTS